MKTQSGWPLSAEAFASGLVKQGDLIQYDGPILSHYTSRSKKKHYLFSWVDYDETYNRWLVLEATLVQLYDYLTNAISLADIFEDGYNNRVILLHTDASGTCSNGLLVPADELVADYQPDADSYYELAMPASYERYFENAKTDIEFAGHLQNLRAEAVRFRLAPFENRFASTIGAGDIGGFLQRVTRSFKSYVEVRFLFLFSGLFRGEEQMLSALSKVLNMAEPRSVFTKHGSFEIDLAVDILPLIQVDSAIIDWQKQALQEYKRDVFDFDFATNGRPLNLLNATDEQLRAIYLPLIQIANNPNYYVETRIEKQTDYQVLKPVSRAISRQIAPAKPKTEETDVAIETELTNVLLELQKGQDIRNISLTQLRRAMISVSTGDQSSSTVSGFRTAEGQVLEFSESIDVSLSRIGDLYQASYTPWDISVLGATGKAAMDAFYNELRKLYARFQRNQEDRQEQRGGLRSEREGRILDAFGELLVSPSL
ncbi:hypothetical protein FNT36_14460 [Hymenobacter setariae]|uniref:Uncharacterized protein n=1 Tax=Hymenobacter setariae TaxID=2594794 RepID=A0A558BVY1_9BACT|nr:hypothetical protein [Hymenobacter setariae]TVT40667.1 hypothetical protein FNT36_14460 [Hymenobacter setariae]